MRAVLLLFLITSSVNCFTQSDSTVFRSGVMADRVYLSYDEFRHNRGILKDQVRSDMDTNQLDFITKLLQGKTFEYLVSDRLQTAETATVFGYFQNSTFYINYKGSFYRVPVFGAISYFVANEVVTTTFYDPRFGYPSGSARTTEIREFVMDFYDGQTRDLTMKKAEELLARDASLYAQFKKLRKRKQKEELYGYIRKYNEQHPVYFMN